LDEVEDGGVSWFPGAMFGKCVSCRKLSALELSCWMCMCGCALAHAFSRVYYGARALGFAGLQVVAKLVSIDLVVSLGQAAMCALGWR
jgi:hypothetical protein